jgi:hypothetical protein
VADAAPDYRQGIYQSLISRGLNPEQARGAIISMMGESGQGLSPKSYNPNDPGGAMGFGQWVGPRRAGLQATAASMGTTETNPTAQLAYFNQEIAPGGPKAWVVNSIKNDAKTAADATGIWTRDYEVPAKDNSAQRFAGNQNAITIGKDGNPVFSTNAPPGPAPPTAVASAATPGTTINTTGGGKLPQTPGEAWAAATTQDASGQSPLQKMLGDAKKDLGGDQQQQQQPPPQPDLQAQQAATGFGMQHQQQVAQAAQQAAAALQQRAAKPFSWGSAPPGTTLSGIPAIGASAGEQEGGAQAFLPQWEQWQRMAQYAPGLEVTPPGMTLNSTGGPYG